MRPNEKPWSHKFRGFLHLEDQMNDTRAVMRSLPLLASVLGRKYGVKVEIRGFSHLEALTGVSNVFSKISDYSRQYSTLALDCL